MNATYKDVNSWKPLSSMFWYACWIRRLPLRTTPYIFEEYVRNDELERTLNCFEQIFCKRKPICWASLINYCLVFRYNHSYASIFIWDYQKQCQAARVLFLRFWYRRFPLWTRPSYESNELSLYENCILISFQPHRVRMTHNLIVNYGLTKMMDVCRPKLATPAQLTKFHTDDYINFLRVINPGEYESNDNQRVMLISFSI